MQNTPPHVGRWWQPLGCAERGLPGWLVGCAERGPPEWLIECRERRPPGGLPLAPSAGIVIILNSRFEAGSRTHAQFPHARSFMPRRLQKPFRG